MNRALLMVGGLVVFGAAQTVHAQYMQPQVSPYGNTATTPYINLLQRNVNPAIQYQGIVQPQLQAQTRFGQLQNEITTNRQMYPTIAPPRNSGVADTGYAPARFMQYQQYYFTLPTGRGAGNPYGGSAAAGGAPPAAGTLSATFGRR
ncbi:MAG TPA: hypothetical protein VN688_20295 [Gemmataceae bacterium]|nr:hypothetical protein [Gemmataceae bacterium]